MSPAADDTAAGLPLVVQIAFAGSRSLYDVQAHPHVDALAFEARVLEFLCKRLANLRADLRLPGHYRFCGISSLARGADTLFARACQSVLLGWRHCVLLPQPREDFLAAAGSSGPDFTLAQAAAVRSLFGGAAVIEERVVGTSVERHIRFEEVNLELARGADVVVCLLRADATERVGGTASLITLAARRHLPALQITLSVDGEGAPRFEERWHWNAPKTASGDRRTDLPPWALPAPLPSMPSPHGGTDDEAGYFTDLRRFCGAQARKLRSRFVAAAWVIVGAHVVATALALWAVKSPGSAVVPWILAAELCLLAAGWSWHRWLHRSHAVREWAMARLVAEIARSVVPMSGVPGRLHYLFALPMPAALRPLLLTLNTLHLQGAARLQGADWRQRRDAYASGRLMDAANGQVPYYSLRLRSARRWLRVAHGVFLFGSLGALTATAAKLLLLGALDAPTAILGFLAVLLPVVAVAALSLAASFDLEARTHTYADMLAFLEVQATRIGEAATENEFAALATEAEARLLGETANWFARRAFLGVS